ncbi:Integrase [Theobroma cacao]|nr:Integrase [Theobroma cacao]
MMKLVNQIRLLGETLSDARVVEKVLISLPKRFDAIGSSLELNRAARKNEKTDITFTVGMKGKEHAKALTKKNVSEIKDKEKGSTQGRKVQNKMTRFPVCPHCKKRSHTKAYAGSGLINMTDDAQWLLDSGSSNHVTPNSLLFTQLDTHYQSKVRIGNGVSLNVVGKGTVGIQTPSGPMSQESLSGSKYFITFVDDFSIITWIYFLKFKHEAFEMFIKFREKVEKETSLKLKCLRSDNGGEHTLSQFDNYLEAEGIHHQLTIPSSPQQNEVSERKYRSILDMGRCLLFEKDPSKNFGKPSVDHLKVFESICYHQILESHITKLDFRSEIVVFIGYSEQPKWYRLYLVRFNKVIVSKNVIFDENAKWN